MTAVDIIKRIRFDLRLSQAELGRRCGLKREYIWRLEKGLIVPKLTTINKILDACGYKLEMMVTA